MRTSQPSSLAVLRRKCLSWVGHIARNQKGCPILKSVHELKKKPSALMDNCNLSPASCLLIFTECTILDALPRMEFSGRKPQLVNERFFAVW